MNQIWKPTEPKSDKLILIRDNCIYKGNPVREELNKIKVNTQDIEKLKNVYSIPFRYIKRIENQQNSKQIKIYFGSDSEEEIKLENETQKNEIFNLLKQELPNLNYRSELPNIFKYTKPQIFGILIATGIFIWAMYFAVEISKGYNYEIVGGGRLGINGMVLLIAKLGIPKLIIGYIIIVGIAVFSLMRRLKTRSDIEILER
ncbi:hypothetical protein [uncultured Marixanthomonas sp.]|uniref:hypothetical protein n=1 Tax=uncultured Marixanthomonas sp. TaxID=757245 RepID=UPI0030D83E51|tara:strand:+ start:70 stop:675 length:606 start_codon:yes stop_codon:yes gene_type:complete